jgi:chromosome segregation ATPase
MADAKPEAGATSDAGQSNHEEHEYQESEMEIKKTPPVHDKEEKQPARLGDVESYLKRSLELCTSISTATKEGDRQSAEIMSLQQELHTLLTEAACASKEQNILTKEPQNTVPEVTQLEDELRIASEELNEAKAKLTNRQSELKEHKDKIGSLERELEQQLEDWDQLEIKLGQADQGMRTFVSETQEIEELRAKLADNENLKSHLVEANTSLHDIQGALNANAKDLKEKESTIQKPEKQVGESQSTNSLDEGRDMTAYPEWEVKLAEKDEVIAGLRREIQILKQNENPEPEDTGDFATLNDSLKRFSHDIVAAKSELEEAQKRMSLM